MNHERLVHGHFFSFYLVPGRCYVPLRWVLVLPNMSTWYVFSLSKNIAPMLGPQRIHQESVAKQAHVDVSTKYTNDLEVE